MGWEAQCGADLRHLLHTLQHLPMDPQQAATNVAPLVTLCTTRFAALPPQPASQTSPAHPSDSPPRPRHLHRSLTENDAHLHQQSSPTQSHTLSARGNDQHGNQGIGDEGQAGAQQQRSGPSYAQSANGLQNGQAKMLSKLTPDVTMSVPPDLQLQEPNEEHSRADGNSVSEPAVALEDQMEQNHLRSISEEAIELDIDQQHSLIDGVQQAADVLDPAADGDTKTSNDGDMVATNNEPLAASNLDVSALLMQSDVKIASDLADVMSDKPA